MKTKKISLRNLNDEILSANEHTHLLGGADECGCGCNGPSSMSDNMSANYGSGLILRVLAIILGMMGKAQKILFAHTPDTDMVHKMPLEVLVVVMLVGISHTSLNAQRKDTDAKISIANNVKSATEGREKVSDANIRIRYAFNAEDMADKSTWIDEGQLKIAPDMTDYSSYFIEVNEDSLANWFNTHGRNVAYPPARWLGGYKCNKWIEYQYSQITTKDGVLTEWATMPRELDSENLYYTENLPLFNWQIGTETATVCGYECIKATCHWRGRDFTAWFTPDIPVEYGPWKFGGLPGLIMKVSDNDGIYTFEAVAVENGNFPIFAPRGNKYAKSTREKVWKLQRALNENYLKATGYSVYNIRLGREISSREHPYSQLELE